MNRTEARALLDESMTEATWQRLVMDYAHAMGWTIFHDNDSRRNAAGLPDLVMTRRGRLVLAELKKQKGKVRPAQQVWLDELGPAPHTTVGLWRPEDWEWVQEALK